MVTDGTDMTTSISIQIDSNLKGLLICAILYTEHQKKHITSSERHSLKSKASKWIIFGHRLAIVILIKHILKDKDKGLLGSKRRKMQ